MDMKNRNIVVISGPSGSGKSTMILRLMQKYPELIFSVSHTTRPPRGSEEDGKNYHFVSRQAFMEMVDKNQFVEWADVYGNFYGTSYSEIESKSQSGKCLVLDIDVQGARNIKKRFPEALLIFVIPPSMEELRRRLVNRDKTVDANMERRLTIAREEVKQYRQYDYIIVNDQLDQAFNALDAVYTAFRHSSAHQEPVVEALLAKNNKQ